MNYTRQEAERDYKPFMRRKQVFELGIDRLGFTRTYLKKLTEGKDAPLKPERFLKQKRGYFRREDVLRVLFV